MAILRDVPGVQVQVVVDGKALKEYDDPGSAEASTSTCKYIEAISEKNFEIHVNGDDSLAGDHDIAIGVFADGNEIMGYNVRRGWMKSSWLIPMNCAITLIDGVLKNRRLRFSNLATCKCAQCVIMSRYIVRSPYANRASSRRHNW